MNVLHILSHLAVHILSHLAVPKVEIIQSIGQKNPSKCSDIVSLLSSIK